MLQLHPGLLRVGRGRRDKHFHHYFVPLEHVLAQHVLARADEVIVERDGSFAVRSRDLGLRIERKQSRRRVGWVNDVTQFAADDRVKTVISGYGKTGGSTFFVAVEIRPAKEPAARALVDIPA